MAVKINLVILFLACAACLPSLYAANWAEPDQHVLDNAKKAMDSSLSAYNEDPEAVTRRFNKQVGKLLEKEHLLERKMIEVDACATMNPIDRCWRCDPTWLQNRKKLAECARGFARGVTGGADGDFYLVTDPSDDDMVTPKPGTLRHAVTRNVPLWIVFERSMVITLRQELMINSNKTIDGRGAIVRIAFGSGLTVAQQQNVIIHNIRIHNIHIASGAFIRDTEDHFGLRTQSDGDAISLFTASRIWIDHVSMARAADGLIDAIEGSTAITISNCKFNHHNDVMLLGAHDEYLQDQIMQVTIAFNRFGRGLIQRMPRCRLGFFHVVNNDYSRWEMYAIGGSAHPTIVSQGNRFRAAKNGRLKEVTHRDYAAEEEWRNWQWRSEGDVFLNGAYFVESGEPLQLSPLSNLTNKIDFQPGAFVDALTHDAGVLVCRPGFPC